MKHLSFFTVLLIVISLLLSGCSKQFTVTFDACGGIISSDDAVQSVKEGSAAVPPSVSREGYSFEGWDQATDSVTADITVKATWIRLWTVTFDTDGGVITSGSGLLQVKDGSPASAPELSRDGYAFDGWDSSFENVTSDITVKALWTKLWTVTFDTDGGTVISGDTVIQTRDLSPVSAPEASRSGYAFDGWDNRLECVSSDMTVKAIWTKLWTVTFNTGEGTVTSGDTVLTVRDGSSAAAPSVTRSGYRFDGWDKTTDSVLSDMTVTAIWTPAYTVTFDANGGSIVSGTQTQSVIKGDSAVAPSVSRTGYVFSGWDRSFTGVVADITVTATWTPVFTVTFDITGGTLVSGSAVQYIVSGKSASLPTVSKEGYVLDSWNGNYQNISGSTTVTAVWKEKTYTSTELFEYATPRTVEVYAYMLKDDSEAYFLGTGFFTDANGTVVTCFHIIDSSYRICVKTSDGIMHEVANVLRMDMIKDIAVLETGISGNEYFKASGRDIVTGETVYTIGSSEGYEYSFSNGLISSVSRIMQTVDCIQITAPISSGNSGGPLLNVYGEVLGIISRTNVDGQNINFAIKINNAENLAKSTTTSIASFPVESLFFAKGVVPFSSAVYENESTNNAAVASTPAFSSGTTYSGTCSAVDRDYYRVELKPGEAFYAMLSLNDFINEFSNIVMIVLDSESNMVDYSFLGFFDGDYMEYVPIVNDSDTVQTYYLTVFSDRSAVISYKLFGYTYPADFFPDGFFD